MSAERAKMRILFVHGQICTNPDRLSGKEEQPFSFEIKVHHVRRAGRVPVVWAIQRSKKRARAGIMRGNSRCYRRVRRK